MTNWKEFKLGEIADVQNGYAFKSSEFSSLGIPIIKIKNIVPPAVSLEEVAYYSLPVDKRLEKFLVKKKDFLISMTGSTVNQMASAVGKMGRYPFDIPALMNQRVGKIYGTSKNVSNDYLYYYLSRFEVQFELASTASGSANQANISPEQIKSLKILLPDIGTQAAIAEILTSLDDKIELNNQINRELEALAQALFKHWFIDFEFPDENGQPYKSSGGEMVDSELGEIPKGWRVGVLDDVVTVKGGTTPSTKQPELWDGEHHWTSPKDLSNLQFPVLLNTEKRITDLGLKKVSSGLLPKGTLLLSSRAPIGYLAITEIETAINQGYIAINCKNGFSNLYMLYWLKQNMDLVIERANGSTFLEISKSNFKDIKITIPKIEIHNLYIKETGTLFELLTGNIKENEELKSLRDMLLPKLISGELELSEALTETAI